MKSSNVNKLRIGDVAKQLEVKEFVIRFWEREFKIKARRSAGGQRFYTKQQVAFLSEIKELLYTKEFTIAGAKKHLELLKKSPQKTVALQEEQSLAMVAAKRDVSEQGADADQRASSPLAHVITQQLTHVKEQLLKIKELLL